MISIRLEGDPEESAALIAAMQAAGIEVQVGTRKARREGFTHTYAVARLADWTTDRQGPIRVDATLGDTPRELPDGRDRTPRRRR